MPWQDKGGGGGPWGGGQGPWGRGPGGQRPPDIEEFLRRGQDRFKRLLPGGWGGGRTLLLVIVIVAFIAWVFSGFYRVEPEEQGVAMIFGRYWATTPPGLSTRASSRALAAGLVQNWMALIENARSNTPSLLESMITGVDEPAARRRRHASRPSRSGK